MGDLSIRRFANYNGPLKEFLDLPALTGRLQGSEAEQERIYSEALLNPDNSFHRNSVSMSFLAYRGATPAGRLTAFHNRLLKDHRAHVGLVGQFCCDDDLQIAKSLFSMAATWMEAQGLTLMRGPLDGDIWHRWRFMVRGFDTPPFPAEPRHPQYYPGLFVRCGFAPVRSYCTKTIVDPRAQFERLGPAVQSNQQRGIVFEDVAGDRVNGLMPTLHDVYVNSMQEVWSSTAAPIEEFSAVFKRHLAFIQPEFVILARDKSGGAVGLGLAVCAPPDTVNVLTVVALPSQAGMSLGQAIVGEIYRRGLEQGKKTFQHCMLDPFSPAQRWDHGEAEITREYVLYERSL